MKAYVVEREHLAQNIRAIREEAGESIVWAVLKGNGYGLGVVQMAELMRENGIDPVSYTHLDVYKRQRYYLYYPVCVAEYRLKIILCCDFA